MPRSNRGARNHVYALRRIRGLGQKQLAHLLGYRGAGMVSRIENGGSVPPLEVALLIEIVLGARLSDVYHDEYRRLEREVLRRCEGLPPHLTRGIRGRLTGKD